jgi:hypothetical protein
VARREDFDNSIWNDPDFLALSSDARLVYIWTWTNPRCGMAGIYKLAPSQAAAETGLPEVRVRTALVELGEARFAFYEGNVLWVRTRVKHLRQKTKQIAVAVANDLRRISDSNPLKAQFLATYAHHVWLKDYVSGEGRVSLENPSSDPIHPVDGHSTVTGGGNGGGTGEKGWGPGKGNNRFSAPVSLAWAPSPEDVAMRDEHFPDWEVEAVANSAATLRLGRKPVTVEAVRGLLTGEEAA